jgi:hypothetical protein
MNRFALALAAAATFATTMLAPQPTLQAKDKGAGSAVQIPVTGTNATGDKFVGTFNLSSFAASGKNVVAVGTVTGTVTHADGSIVGSALQTVAIPVTVGSQGAAAAAIAPAAVCEILHLDLGPLHLNLLGLQIDLSRIVLDITAVPGAGNLLGNLLCAVAGLLDNPGGLAALLNQILAALLAL